MIPGFKGGSRLPSFNASYGENRVAFLIVGSSRPVIAAPTSTIFLYGEHVGLKAPAAFGIQWMKNGEIIPGAIYPK